MVICYFDMRALSTSALAVLIVLALFWGNCFSCPQLLLLVANHGSAHSCCKRPVPVDRTCLNVSLKHFVKAEPAMVTPPAVVAALVAPPVAVTVSVEPAPAREVPHSPPDLQALLSAFRI